MPVHPRSVVWIAENVVQRRVSDGLLSVSAGRPRPAPRAGRDSGTAARLSRCGWVCHL